MTDDATATICDRASLSVLGVLDGDESRLFEAHLLEGCPACREEVDGMQFVAEALAWSAPPLDPPASLRARLLESIRQPEMPSLEASGASLAFEDDGPWRPYAVPGIEYRMLHLDRATREIVMLVRAEPGARYPKHDHASAEDMFMLRGELLLDGATYRPGAFIRSTVGSHHGVGDTATGCMFLMRGSIDDLVLADSEMPGIDRTPATGL